MPTPNRTEYMKRYAILNKDKIALNRAKHKESTLLRRREHHDCPCGGSYSSRNKSRHIKSTIHQDYVLNRPPHDPTIKCPCGGSFHKHNLNRHLRTKMHHDYLNPSAKPPPVEYKPRVTVPECVVEWVDIDAKVKPPPLV